MEKSKREKAKELFNHLAKMKEYKVRFNGNCITCWGSMFMRANNIFARKSDISNPISLTTDGRMNNIIDDFTILGNEVVIRLENKALVSIECTE